MLIFCEGISSKFVVAQNSLLIRASQAMSMKGFKITYTVRTAKNILLEVVRGRKMD